MAGRYIEVSVERSQFSNKKFNPRQAFSVSHHVSITTVVLYPADAFLVRSVLPSTRHMLGGIGAKVFSLEL